MSEFSEKLKEYIAKSNVSVFQLSKQTGLERTMLARMVNGKRLPDISVLQKLCENLQVTTYEEKKLYELYKIEEIGRDVCANRKEIHKLIEGIQALRADWGRVMEFPQIQAEELLQEQQRVVPLSNDIAVHEAIRYAIQKEIMQEGDSRIDLDMSDRCEYALRFLIQQDKETEKSIVCNHFLHFKRNQKEMDNGENVKLLKLVIPFAFTFQNTYRVHYSYMEETSHDDLFRLWPHFLVTRDCVILMTENGNGALLIENKRVAEEYQKELEVLAQKYSLLFTPLHKDVDQILNDYYQTVFDSCPEWVVESHPCVSRMVYPELQEHEKGNSYVGLLVENYYRVLKDNVQKKRQTVYYFNRHELKEFMLTGKLPGIYGSLSRKYTETERRKMLEHFIECMDDGLCKNYLLKEERLSVSEGLDIELYANDKISIISTSGKYPFGIITLKESGICNSFRDYCSALMEEGYVYDMEESKRILRELLE